MESARIKDSYTISEVSRLFGMGIDSLRYYERLGIITPRRAANGYRLYELDDMYKLALIKDLRRLDVPMKAIKAYLDQQDLASTLALLQDEERLLDERIAQLVADRAAVRAHAHELRDALQHPVGVPILEYRTARRCVTLSARIERDEEMDVLIQRLHRQYEHILPHLGTLEIGGALSQPELMAGRANVYDSVFFVLEDAETKRPAAVGPKNDEPAEESPGLENARAASTAPYDELLPAGDYLIQRYRGPYEQNARVYQELRTYAQAHGLELANQPYEFYEIDNRDTADPAEFLTRIEIHVVAP